MIRYIVIEAEYCKGCELCVSVCPPHVIALSQELNPRGYYPAIMVDGEHCTGCCYCAVVCPDAAIEVYLDERPEGVQEGDGHK